MSTEHSAESDAACQSGDDCKWTCDQHESPMAYVEANGFVDFPTAWKIARRTAPEYHHNECSFNTTGGVILCDCDVLTKSPEYIAAYVTPPAKGDVR